MSLLSLGINVPAPSSPQPPPDDTLLWLNAAVTEADAFLASQPGYSEIERAIDAIMSRDTSSPSTASPPLNPGAASRSTTRTNRIAKITDDLASMLTDTKPFWDYQVSNRRFEKHAEITGKLATFWYQKQSADMVVADLARYYVAAGCAYLYKYWDPDTGDICVRALDPRNVLPIQPRNYASLEFSRGVIIREKVPVSYIKDRYNVDIPPDSDGAASSVRSSPTGDGDIQSPIHKWAKTPRSQDKPKIPCVWLYTCWLKDPRTHDSVKPREMGQFMDDPAGELVPDASSPTGFSVRRIPANNWSYVVNKGDPLFPNRRMIVWAGTHKLYDGPNIYWSGCQGFPVIKFSLQPYPWSWFGKAPAWDLLPLQESLNRLLRVVDDHAEQVANPGSIHDKNNVPRSEFNNFDTRRAGWKIYQNPLAGKGIQVVNPPALDSSLWEHIKWILDEMDTLAGTRDLTQLTRLNQLPSNDTVESILNSMTPGIRLRSRMLEAFMREWATQMSYDFAQFYSVNLRVTILGPGGVTQDDFDFDPGSLIPDYIHDGDFDQNGSITPEALARGPLPRYNRVKELLRRFTFKVAPGSLLNAAQLERKLIFLQLARAGWMDIFTLWEEMGIPNIGVLPDNVRTIPERLLYQQMMGLTGQINSAGRKATGQDVPRIVTKESA